MRCNRISLVGKILIAIAVLILIALVIVLPIVLLTTSNSTNANQEGGIGINATIAATTNLNVTIASTERTKPLETTLATTTVKPFDVNELKGDEATRIDCFLDSQSRFENLTKYACEKRNCIYDPNVSHPLVPKCYFDRENLGYRLKKKLDKNEYLLTQKGKAPFSGVIENIQLNVEYYCSNIIRVKVINYY